MRSSERARDLGEVFTPEKTVHEMLDLLQDINYSSKFLEPGCGSGNFLVEILSRKMMHPDYANFYFIGLFQPIGCIWPLADYQAKLACLEILGKYERPRDIAARIKNEVDHPHFDFGPGQRHAMEVDYHTFRKELKEELKKQA